MLHLRHTAGVEERAGVRAAPRVIACGPPIVIEGLIGLGCDVVARTGFLQQVPSLAARSGAEIVVLHTVEAMMEVAHAVIDRLRHQTPGVRVILMLPEARMQDDCEVLAHDCDAATLRVILGADPRMPGVLLTLREIEVLRLVGEGMTNRSIGQRMGLAENTVKNYLRHVHQKLDVRSRTEAVLVAARAGYPVLRVS